MKTRSIRSVRFDTDPDGTPIAVVPLANHSVPVRLLASDFDALRAAGLSDQWFLNASGDLKPAYVRCGYSLARGQLATVARLIVGAIPGQSVHYRDGDRLNLRRANLHVAGRRRTATPAP